MLRRPRWCDAHWLVDSRNFLDVPLRSLVLPLVLPARSVIWASTSTATLALPPMYEEPCRGVLLHYGNFVSYVDTSPMTAFVLSWSRSSTLGSTMATSYSSGFLSTSSNAFKPCLTLQLVWCSDSVATTTWLTPSRYCTGCVCRNGSTSNWRSWHIVCWTVWRRHIWINSFWRQTYQVVAVCGRHSYSSWLFHLTVYQQLAVVHFL